LAGEPLAEAIFGFAGARGFGAAFEGS